MESLKLRNRLEETEQEIEILAAAKSTVQKIRLEDLRQKAASARTRNAAVEARESERLIRYLEGMELLQRRLDSVDSSEVGDEGAGIRD